MSTGHHQVDNFWTMPCWATSFRRTGHDGVTRQQGELQVHAGEVGQPAGEPAKTMKSKVWQSVTEQLKTQGGVPMYAGKQLCTKAGRCSVNGDIADGSSIS